MPESTLTDYEQALVMNCTFKMVSRSENYSTAMRPGRRSRDEKIRMIEIKTRSQRKHSVKRGWGRGVDKHVENVQHS